MTLGLPVVSADLFLLYQSMALYASSTADSLIVTDIPIIA